MIRLVFLPPLLLTFVLLFSLPLSAKAAPGEINPSFTSQGFNTSAVNKAKYLPDGDLLVSGSFNFYGGSSDISNIIRLNEDGSRDPALGTQGSGFTNNQTVIDFYPRADEKIWAAGSFTDFDGAADASKIVLLNPNGTRDPSFDTDHVGDGSGFALDIWAVEEMSDGDILVGGTFTSYGNEPDTNGLLRLNPDGTIDATWSGVAFGGGVNGSVYDIETCADGKIIVAGDFSTFNGQSSYNRLLRLNSDGTLDNTFQIVGSGFNLGGVYDVECQDDGDVFAGGSFGAYNGVARPNVLRLNANGSLDTGFAAAPDNTVLAIAELPTGKIAVGGLFDKVSGENRRRIAQLNPDGSLDTSFTVGSGLCSLASCSADTPRVNSFAVDPEGNLMVAGEMRFYNGQSAEQLSLLFDSARLETSLTGSGAIGSTSTISCPGTCSDWFDQGTSISLTATAASDYNFAGWSGDCFGVGTCQLTLDSGKSVNAQFSPVTPPDPPNPPEPPTPTLTISDIRVRISQKRVVITSKATVSAPGIIKQTAKSGKKTWCKVNRRLPDAYAYKLSCKLGKAARKRIKSKALRLSLVTVLTANDGGVAQNKRTVKIPRKQ